VHHPLIIKTTKAPDGCGGANNSGRAGDVPSCIVVRRRNRISNAGSDFEAEYEGVKKINSAHLARTGIAKQRSGDGRRRVAIGFGVVSSKSRTCEEIPFTNAARNGSRRSLRPSMAAVPPPANGIRTRIAMLTASSAAAPTAQPMKLSKARRASWRTSGGMSSILLEAT
jgi:hypothetical protein